MTNDDSSMVMGVPVGVWDETLCMFRVEHSKGKSLSSGGFGVAISCKIQHHDDNSPPETKSNTSPITNTASTLTTITRDHLFLEEAMFLHEQGLLECRQQQQPKETNAATDAQTSSTTNAFTKLSLFDLYALLPKAQLSLAIYLTYAHLRAQTYRVMRHSPHRRSILQAQQDYLQQQSRTSDNNNNNKHSAKSAEFQNLKLKLRHDLQTTLAPQVHTAISFASSTQSLSSLSSSLLLQPAFDVYAPQSTFSKSHPGLPDFHVIVFYYAELLPLLFPALHQLARDCEPIPVKVATVSDSGVVVMFGLCTMQVPSLIAE
jgi:hypothetical protein